MIRDRLVLSVVGLVVTLALCVAYLVTEVLDLPLTGEPTRVTVALPRTGGLYEGSGVTYRGDQVGRVRSVRLTDEGVRAQITLRPGTEVPRDAPAEVRRLSPVGEQYLDFQPRSAGGPYLADGDVVRAAAVQTPVLLSRAMGSLIDLMDSIDRRDLRVVMRELAAGTQGTAGDLESLLEDSDRLLRTLDDSWPETRRLLRNGRTVGQTFADRRPALRHFAQQARLVGEFLREFDPRFRTILRQAPGNLDTLGRVVVDLQQVLPPALRSLAQVTGLLSRHEPHLRELLAVLPYGVGRFADAFTDGWLEIDLEVQGLRECDYGAQRRDPMSGERRPLRTEERCAHPERLWRGAPHAPPPLRR